MMRASAFRALPFVLAGLALLPALALAQEAESPPPAGEQAPAPEEPEPVEAPEIAANAEATSAALREVRSRLAPDLQVVAVEAALESESGSIQEEAETIDPEQLDRNSLRDLEDLQQRWSQVQSRVGEWEATLLDRSEDLDGERESLQAQRQTWETIRETSSDLELPPALRARINETLAAIDTVQDLLQERREYLLTLQDRVSDLKIRIGEVLDAIREAEETARRRLLTFDTPPLWQALIVPEEEEPPIVEQVTATWSRDAESLRRYFQSNEQAFRAHAVLFVLSFGAMIILARRRRKWSLEDDSLQASAHILSYPASAALLLTLMLTRSLHPGGPAILFEVNRLLLLIPVLRILPGLLPAVFRVPLYGVAFVYVLERIPAWAADRSLSQRFLHIAVTGLALSLLAWFVRGKGAARSVVDNSWWRASVSASRLGLLILAGSLAANLLGAFALAKLLTSGTLTSAYTGVVLFASVLVLNGMMAILVRSRLSRKLRSVQVHQTFLKRRWSTLLNLAAAATWALITLHLFNVLDPLTAWLGAALGHEWTLGTVVISLGDILVFGLAIYLSILASKILRFFLDEDILPRIDLPRGVSGSISMLIHYVILAVGFLIALGLAGIEMTRFALLAGALGVGIGFGLQNIVNNFVSGLILIFERPVKVGDVIEVGTLRGRVKGIGIRASTVRTFDGAEIIVPNGNLISSEVVNWTLSDQIRRVELPVGVAYGTDVRKVQETLLKAARDHEEVLSFPEPVALFSGFGESSLDFLLRFWTADYENWMRISSDVAVEVNDALKGAGIEIPFPQRDLHVRSVDPAAGKALGGEEGPAGGGG